MSRNLRLGTLVLTALALLLSVSVLTAGAAGVTNTSPMTAAVIDNQTHTIAANSSLWYRFDYAGDRSQITAMLVNGNNTGLGFDVFTPAQIGDWFNETPIGKGTAQSVNCDTGAPGLGGKCRSNDLMWLGQFNANGTYYIQVINNTGSALSFQLMIQGDGVALASPAAAMSQPSNVGGAAVPAPQTNKPGAGPTTANTDPAHALVIDNQTHTIAANSSLWYRFDYAGDRSQITAMLVNGNNTGLGFDVFTPAQIGDWFNETPIGKGTAQSVNCDTGAPGLGGKCRSNDLMWLGQFNANGTYYIQVINNTGSALSFQLMIQGDGVALAPQMQSPSTMTAPTMVPQAAPTTTSSNPPTTSTTPAASAVANTDPGHAVFIDNAPHTIPANSSLWYRFNYAGDRSQITATLANASNSGTAFKVFTPAQIGDWWETPPIGQGTTQTINCDTGAPEETGGCQSNDLMWIGQFNANGTYYIEVINNNSNSVTAQLKIQGDGVALGQ